MQDIVQHNLCWVGNSSTVQSLLHIFMIMIIYTASSIYEWKDESIDLNALAWAGVNA